MISCAMSAAPSFSGCSHRDEPPWQPVLRWLATACEQVMSQPRRQWRELGLVGGKYWKGCAHHSLGPFLRLSPPRAQGSLNSFKTNDTCPRVAVIRWGFLATTWDQLFFFLLFSHFSFLWILAR